MSEVLTRMYEGMFLVDAGIASTDWDTVLEAVNTVLSRAKADVKSVRKWDERRLAYPVGKCKRGTYILSYFEADPEAIAGIERDVVLSETLLRAMILRADRIPQEMIEAETPAGQAQRAREESEARAAEKAKAVEEAKAAKAAEKAEAAKANGDDVSEEAVADSDIDAAAEGEPSADDAVPDVPEKANGLQALAEDVRDMAVEKEAAGDEDAEKIPASQ